MFWVSFGIFVSRPRWLVYWRIMPDAERLLKKWTAAEKWGGEIWGRSFRQGHYPLIYERLPGTALVFYLFIGLIVCLFVYLFIIVIFYLFFFVAVPRKFPCPSFSLVLEFITTEMINSWKHNLKLLLLQIRSWLNEEYCLKWRLGSLFWLYFFILLSVRGFRIAFAQRAFSQWKNV